ncbi:MAG: hypothetical protein P8K77_05305 [Polaribacter sp.]|nr:hypothetical protein [Polaribacter sp.]
MSIKYKKEYWNVKKSGIRLLWRFQKDESGRFKNFTPTEADEISLKSVLAWVNRQSDNNVNNNHLFVKLFVYHLTTEIRESETSIFDSFLQAKVSLLLNKPLALFYEAFKQDLYINQFQRLIKEKGIVDDKDAVIDYTRFTEVYSPEFVMSKLNEMASEAINRFS